MSTFQRRKESAKDHPVSHCEQTLSGTATTGDPTSSSSSWWESASLFFSNVAHWFLRQRPHSFVGWCFYVSRELGPAEPRNMLQICTYNPLTASTRQGCRLEEILFTLQTNHMILLTGAERPRAHCSPVTHSVLAGNRLFEWGSGMGRGTNRHAGLIVAETWQIREVASPQAGVQGRRGAIRVKTSKLDLFLIGLYPPPLRCMIGQTRWCMPHRLDVAWWLVVI